MALALENFEQKARDAIQAFWGNREAARKNQIKSGKSDQGERAGVTAGKNKEGLYTTASLIASPREACQACHSGNFRTISNMTSLKTFVTSLAGHIAAEAARLNKS